MSTLDKNIDQTKFAKFVPRFAQVYQSEETQKWYLLITKHYGYKYEDTGWQACDILGKMCTTPGVDIEEELVPCGSEKEAMYKLAEFYHVIFKNTEV